MNKFLKDNGFVKIPKRGKHVKAVYCCPGRDIFACGHAGRIHFGRLEQKVVVNVIHIVVLIADDDQGLAIDPLSPGVTISHPSA